MFGKCHSIWGNHPPQRKTADDEQFEQYLIDCMQANRRVGQAVRCPCCHAAVTISQEGDEEHVICNWCGLVAVDGCIVVSGNKEA